jgi:hypothetical protein
LSSTDKVLAGFEQLSQSTSQQASKTTSQPVSQSTSQPDVKLVSQPNDNDKSTTQPADKSAIRKATFQLNEAVLQQLDKFHLQLQLELGKGSAPYKEVIVEEALARLLEQAQSNPEALIAVLCLRQEKRK